MRLEFHDDPASFVTAAGSFLAARPVASTIVSTVTDRIIREDGAGVARPPGPAWWWLVVRDESGAVVGAAMRTAPFAPHPPYLLEMPEEAAVQLARVLHARGESIDGLNGALPVAAMCAEELARLSGRSVEVHEHLRLFELGDLIEPVRPLGALRVAREDDDLDVEIALAWFTAFSRDAAAQAGREDPHREIHEDEGSMRRRLRDGRVWLWCDPDGLPVHLTGANPPSFGVARIGPVYTPPERRGHGYASAAVAEVSRLLRDGGARVCLFTDQANPTSNAIYQRLGYRSVEDQVTQLIG